MRFKLRRYHISFRGFIAILALASVLLIHSQSAFAQFEDMQLPGGTPYAIDNSHTSVVFAVSHFGLSYTYGRFNKCSGSFKMENGEPTNAGFDFVIATNSIDTNNEDRDNHLRGADFFDADQFPEITFKTIGFVREGDVYQVTGDMKIRDQTRRVVMPVQLVGIGKGPFGKERAGFFAKFTIKRSDFGMDKMLGSIGDKISITFSFEGIKE